MQSTFSVSSSSSNALFELHTKPILCIGHVHTQYFSPQFLLFFSQKLHYRRRHSMDLTITTTKKRLKKLIVDRWTMQNDRRETRRKKLKLISASHNGGSCWLYWMSLSRLVNAKTIERTTKSFSAPLFARLHHQSTITTETTINRISIRHSIAR